MPTSGKPKQPHSALSDLPKEFFYRDGVLRADADLHNAILDGGDHEAATAVTRKRLKKRGWDDDKIDRFLGAVPH